MDEDEYNRMMQEQSLAGQTADTNSKQMQQQFILEEKERSMIHEQLNLDEEIKRLEHLLRGHIQVDEDGKLVWKEPTDPDMVILTEYGIQLILNTISWYINKNTLLSFYEDEMIMRKMRDFASALDHTIFMEYEKIFKRPDFAECKKVLEARMQKKIDMRMFALQLAGIKGDEKQIKEDFLKEIEGRIEKEMDKIRESIMKSKLTRFLLLNREIQDAIHSTYNRAYRGMERKTLREHIQVTETRGQQPVAQKGGLFSWFKGS